MQFLIFFLLSTFVQIAYIYKSGHYTTSSFPYEILSAVSFVPHRVKEKISEIPPE